MKYGTYDHDLNIIQYKKDADELFNDDSVKYTGAKNFNCFINVPTDTNTMLSNYFSDKLGQFDWDFQYFHSGEPVGLHTDYTIVRNDQERPFRRVDIGIIIPLDWNCKQPYTVNYNRIESTPRKAIFRKGQMRYIDNDEVIDYRTEGLYDEEVAIYNPKNTEYNRLYQDLKVHSVYKWSISTAMVFDTSRWHSSSWFLSDNMLPDVSTEYKRAIIGFGSIDVPRGKYV